MRPDTVFRAEAAVETCRRCGHWPQAQPRIMMTQALDWRCLTLVLMFG